MWNETFESKSQGLRQLRPCPSRLRATSTSVCRWLTFVERLRGVAQESFSFDWSQQASESCSLKEIRRVWGPFYPFLSISSLSGVARNHLLDTCLACRQRVGPVPCHDCVALIYDRTQSGKADQELPVQLKPRVHQLLSP